jgi:hypothetical protein
MPASADVLYDNFPINARQIVTSDTATYLQDQLIADSFVLSANSVLTGVNFGTWVTIGDTPVSVNWSITQVPDAVDDPFAYTSLASGTGATLTNTVFCLGSSNPTTCAGTTSAPSESDVYASYFALPSIALSAGTYYLTLGGAVATSSGEMDWDANSGPPHAWVNQAQSGGSIHDLGNLSESFQILGNSEVPEPGSLVLAASALAGMVLLFRRNRA